MKTLVRDSNTVIPGVRKLGHSFWFLRQASSRGFTVSDEIAERKPIQARVDHGRWLADCPLDFEGQPCLGAECVTEREKTFLCLSCGNTEVEGKLLKVRFPARGKRDKIELSLNERPEANRNWFPGESPEKIAKENRKHKIKVPEGAE